MKLVRINLPPYKDGCDADAAAVDCDYPTDALNKLISTKFADGGSPAVDLVKNFTWTNEDQNLVSTYISEDGMSAGRRGQVGRGEPRQGRRLAQLTV